MRPDAVLVVLESVVEMKEFILLVRILVYNPLQLLSITWYCREGCPQAGSTDDIHDIDSTTGMIIVFGMLSIRNGHNNL